VRNKRNNNKQKRMETKICPKMGIKSKKMKNPEVKGLLMKI